MCENFHQMPVSFEECSNSIWPQPIFRNSIWPQPIFLRSGEPSTRPAVVSFCDPSLNSKGVGSGSWDRIQCNFKQLTTRRMRPRPIPSAVSFLDPVLGKRVCGRDSIWPPPFLEENLRNWSHKSLPKKRKMQYSSKNTPPRV